MEKSGLILQEGRYRRRRRADSDSGIYSAGSGSSARSRHSGSSCNDQESGLDHDYGWRRNIEIVTREGHIRGRRSGSHEYERRGCYDYERSGSYDFGRSKRNDYGRSEGHFHGRSGSHDYVRIGRSGSHEHMRSVRSGSHDYVRSGSQDHGRGGKHEYKRSGSHDIGISGSHEYGSSRAESRRHDYGRTGSHDYGRSGSHDYGRSSSYDYKRSRSHEKGSGRGNDVSGWQDFCKRKFPEKFTSEKNEELMSVCRSLGRGQGYQQLRRNIADRYRSSEYQDITDSEMNDNAKSQKIPHKKISDQWVPAETNQQSKVRSCQDQNWTPGFINNHVERKSFKNKTRSLSHNNTRKHLTMSYPKDSLRRSLSRESPRRRCRPTHHPNRVSSHRLAQISSYHHLPRLLPSRAVACHPHSRMQNQICVSDPDLYSSLSSDSLEEEEAISLAYIEDSKVVHKYIASRGQREKEIDIYEVLPAKIFIVNQLWDVSVC